MNVAVVAAAANRTVPLDTPFTLTSKSVCAVAATLDEPVLPEKLASQVMTRGDLNRITSCEAVAVVKIYVIKSYETPAAARILGSTGVGLKSP